MVYLRWLNNSWQYVCQELLCKFNTVEMGGVLWDASERMCGRRWWQLVFLNNFSSFKKKYTVSKQPGVICF